MREAVSKAPQLHGDKAVRSYGKAHELIYGLTDRLIAS